MLEKTKLFGVDVTTSSRGEILAYLSVALSKKKSTSPITIVTPNPEQLIDAQQSKVFAQLLNEADISLPDGAGIVWALNQSKNGIKINRIPGIDFMQELVNLGFQNSWTLCFIGSRDGASEKALSSIREKNAGLKGWASDGPEMQTVDTFVSDLENEEQFVKKISEKIIKTKTSFVFVGLGAPKQEIVISLIKKELITKKYTSPVVLMSVGGAFDILSGRIPRAPQLMRDFNLEWLWRLTMQPWRLGRQWKLIQFIWLVLKSRYSGKI